MKNLRSDPTFSVFALDRICLLVNGFNCVGWTSSKIELFCPYSPVLFYAYIQNLIVY